jgi:hypothetical protein
MQFGRHGHLYDPTTSRYTALTHGGPDDTPGPTVFTGSSLVRISAGQAGDVKPGDTAALDLNTDSWTPLPSPPYVPITGVSVWTGKELLLWGRQYGDHPPGAQGGLRFGP